MILFGLFCACFIQYFCVFLSDACLDGVDGLSDEDEVIIQTTINEMYNESEQSNPAYSSAVDPYTHVQYGNLDEELSGIKELKCIASAEKLKELLGTSCRQPDCSKKLRSVEVKSTCGYAIKLEWLCEAMHRGFWYSSSIYAAGMSVNYIVETALVLSGMSHHQFMRFCRFVNLTHTSPTSFARNQRLYAAPAIHQEYLRMRDSIIDDVSKAKDLILCGDGRMDSPGFCATKATYSFMEEGGSHRVVNMEHGDKRQVHASFNNVYTVYMCIHIVICIIG